MQCLNHGVVWFRCICAKWWHDTLTDSKGFTGVLSLLDSSFSMLADNRLMKYIYSYDCMEPCTLCTRFLWNQIVFLIFLCMCNISRCWDWWCSNSFRKQWHRTATLLQRESGGFELFGWILQQKLTGSSSRPSDQTHRAYNLAVPRRGQELGFLRSCFWRSAWTASRFVAFLDLVGEGLSLKIDQSRSKLPIWMDVCGSGRSWPPWPHVWRWGK